MEWKHTDSPVNQKIRYSGNLNPSLPMVRKTGLKFQVKSYQRLKKMVLDAVLLNTQNYKERIKGKVEQSSEWSRTLPNS